jgi:hypothetical protein
VNDDSEGEGIADGEKRMQCVGKCCMTRINRRSRRLKCDRSCLDLITTSTLLRYDVYKPSPFQLV